MSTEPGFVPNVRQDPQMRPRDQQAQVHVSFNFDTSGTIHMFFANACDGQPTNLH